mmetsp:Transcript_11717/g.20842  ORF Transcript_11717/g.20842 Transcript_11717/m.20842 type:complete len:118 (+) Transcript_11717:137-490(+)
MAAMATVKYGEISDTFELVEGGRLAFAAIQRRFGLGDDVKINGMVAAVRPDGLTWSTYMDGTTVQVSGTPTAGHDTREQYDVRAQNKELAPTWTEMLEQTLKEYKKNFNGVGAKKFF